MRLPHRRHTRIVAGNQRVLQGKRPVRKVRINPSAAQAGGIVGDGGSGDFQLVVVTGLDGGPIPGARVAGKDRILYRQVAVPGIDRAAFKARISREGAVLDQDVRRIAEDRARRGICAVAQIAAEGRIANGEVRENCIRKICIKRQDRAIFAAGAADREIVKGQVFYRQDRAIRGSRSGQVQPLIVTAIRFAGRLSSTTR